MKRHKFMNHDFDKILKIVWDFAGKKFFSHIDFFQNKNVLRSSETTSCLVPTGKRCSNSQFVNADIYPYLHIAGKRFVLRRLHSQNLGANHPKTNIDAPVVRVDAAPIG